MTAPTKLPDLLPCPECGTHPHIEERKIWCASVYKVFCFTHPYPEVLVEAQRGNVKLAAILAWNALVGEEGS